LSVSKGKKYLVYSINDDLYDLLIEMDIKKKDSDDYVLLPEREVTYLTIMDSLEIFTYYRKSANIEKK
jgi:hypothetical protein